MNYFYTSYPKVNICFKILGILPNNYCNIASRYFRVRGDLFDSICIKDSKSFCIKGDFDCQMSENTIFKAKHLLQQKLQNIPAKQNLAKRLNQFCIEVQKRIPSFAGLGGGSSNAATYLLAMNEILELDLSKTFLKEIAFKIGADVSFFIDEVDFANVFGIGEKIEKITEKPLDLEIITPPIKCATKVVFDEFKKEPRFDFVDSMMALDSCLILKKFSKEMLNDLYLPALRIYPALKDYAKSGYYFSGSGSSFFRIKV